MRRRAFLLTSAGAAVAAALPSLALNPAGRMIRIFRQLRATREGLQPDIAVDRMTRTIADLRAAGIEIERTAGGERPPVGFPGFTHRCMWHESALAGAVGRRKLRCVICETEDLNPEWIRNPFLMRGGFYRVA